MATYVLLHGAGSDSWYWHLVAPRLRERGHYVVAPDLPCHDDSAGIDDYAKAVLAAVGDRKNLIVVAQSMAGFTVPLVCETTPVDLVVLVAAMTPAEGQSPTPTSSSSAWRDIEGGWVCSNPWPTSSWPPAGANSRAGSSGPASSPRRSPSTTWPTM